MTNKTRITMNDIAEAAGVSQSTVSLILNDSQSIKLALDTKKRVFEIADQLGYKHKALSKVSTTRKIALVVNELLSTAPFIDAINGARDAARQENFILSVFDYENDDDYAKLIEQEITTGNYQGIIYSTSINRVQPTIKIKPPIPMVMLNCYPEGKLECPVILPSDNIGAYKVTQHLIDQGYKRIAIITGEQWMEIVKQRIEGYRQALINNDIYPDEQLIVDAKWSTKECYHQTKYLLSLDNPPDAIFCCSDAMSIGCYQAINQLNLIIPNDIAVASYDDQLIASHFTPPLTSVELPYNEMGSLAVTLLFDLINGKKPMVMKQRIEGMLSIRDSTIRTNNNN